MKLLTPETTRLLISTKNKITKDENDEIIIHLENTEVVLVHRNIVNNDYQNDSRVLDTFLSNKSLGQLLNILPKNFALLKTFNQSFYILKYGLLIKNIKTPREIKDYFCC